MLRTHHILELGVVIDDLVRVLEKVLHFSLVIFKFELELVESSKDDSVVFF